jgi:hypothetical protein
MAEVNCNLTEVYVKLKHSGLLSKSVWILISCLLLVPLMLGGCGGGTPTNIVTVDSVSTASNVSMTDGVWDWQQYVEQDSFPSGYEGAFWVMFNFSNILHDDTVNINANIYILSNGETWDMQSKNASITDTTDNTLWWGGLFDISSYADGDYSVIVNITDLIAGTSAAKAAYFEIGAAP